MPADVLTSLLSLSSAQRADSLALALWESLDEPSREAAVGLTPSQAAEFARRVAEHRTHPSTAIPWPEVRRKLSGG